MAIILDEKANTVGMYVDMFIDTPIVKDASDDYRNYLTRTFFNRFDSTLDQYSLFFKERDKVNLNKLYDQKFRDIYLQNPKRDTKHIYTDASSIKKMNLVGIYDFLTSLVTMDTSKYFPLFIPFEKTVEEILNPIPPYTVDKDKVDELERDTEDLMNDTYLPEFDAANMTEDQLKVLTLISKLDMMYEKYSSNLISKYKKMFSQNSLQPIIDMFKYRGHNHIDSVILKNLNTLHINFNNILCLLAYTISCAEVFEKYKYFLEENKIKCKIYDLIQYFSKELLEKRIVPNSDTYYSHITLKLLRNIVFKEIVKDNQNYLLNPILYVFKDPIKDQTDSYLNLVSSLNSQSVMVENWANLRNLLLLDNLNEKDYRVRFIIILIMAIVYFNTFYQCAIYSGNKINPDKLVDEMLNKEYKDYNRLIDQETLWNMIKWDPNYVPPIIKPEEPEEKPNIYNIYTGVSNVSVYDMDFLKLLTKHVLPSRECTIDVDAGENQYIYYCLPSSLGKPKFMFGMFEGGLQKVGYVDDIQNGVLKETYDVYRSDYDGLGKTIITVT